jgi:NAD(P)H-dependent FMN reductase
VTPQLHVILVSTRPGRVGAPVAAWFLALAERHGKFGIHLIDLATVNLPLLDEPHHPRLRQYEHEHTKAWSRTVDAADAFVFVTPEYNYATPPSLVNALDYLHHEWAYKPVGLVSYGGVSGGTRAAQMTKQIVTALRMMPLFEAVSIPFVSQYLDRERGVFAPPTLQEEAATTMLDELLRWTTALRPMRLPG